MLKNIFNIDAWCILYGKNIWAEIQRSALLFVLNFPLTI